MFHHCHHHHPNSSNCLSHKYGLPVVALTVVVFKCATIYSPYFPPLPSCQYYYSFS
ncbi:hypothetical protein HETIRDRAFT_312645 [Heterobasidion irregulare TC 32-1]|uniref:Uncharacterized protein n=1 Tax=Heterobasidion irregulare (strain TC 32-1) TaxID=747525 RepID=W4KHG1_HETIT|nr:uncharacterized protein HETIRDRAFT_312645 [Heterobasidion irregulare TC 32-1]ETW84506.1 hypothetical protein HETIRDRAFT_312645 [Heterobasidion irregulare TC 32-1]